MNPSLKALKLIVTGNVQGVGFRRAVQRLAQRSQIVGSVKNQKDGTVRILAQGEEDNLSTFIGAIKGLDAPVLVDDIQSTPVKLSNKSKVFRIIHGSIEEELDEGLGAGQQQLVTLGHKVDQNFNTLGQKIDNFSATTDQNFNTLGQKIDNFSATTDQNFNTLAAKYDRISETLARVVEESSRSREDFKLALETLTVETTQFREALVNLSNLAKEYLDERRSGSSNRTSS